MAAVGTLAHPTHGDRWAQGRRRLESLRKRPLPARFMMLRATLVPSRGSPLHDIACGMPCDDTCSIGIIASVAVGWNVNGALDAMDGRGRGPVRVCLRRRLLFAIAFFVQTWYKKLGCLLN